MATYEDFLPEIQGRAYGVSEPMVEMYVRSAAIEFCEATRLWRRQVQEYAFEGDGRIDITGIDEDQEELEAILPGTYNGVQIGTVPPAMNGAAFDRYAAIDFEGEQRGAPMYVFELPDEPNTLGVWPVPDKQYADLTFVIALKPKITATVIPDFLLRDYRKAIIEGALASIYDTVGQSFYNPSRAEIAERRFARAILNGKVAANRGRLIGGNLSVQMRPFAKGQ